MLIERPFTADSGKGALDRALQQTGLPCKGFALKCDETPQRAWNRDPKQEDGFNLWPLYPDSGN